MAASLYAISGAKPLSAELKDFRGKVTPETDAVLEALNRATGRDKSEIAREVLHGWASEQLEAARLMVRFTSGEGRGRESKGAAGEDEGAPAVGGGK